MRISLAFAALCVVATVAPSIGSTEPSATTKPSAAPSTAAASEPPSPEAVCSPGADVLATYGFGFKLAKTDCQAKLTFTHAQSTFTLFGATGGQATITVPAPSPAMPPAAAPTATSSVLAHIVIDIDPIAAASPGSATPSPTPPTTTPTASPTSVPTQQHLFTIDITADGKCNITATDNSPANTYTCKSSNVSGTSNGAKQRTFTIDFSRVLVPPYALPCTQTKCVWTVAFGALPESATVTTAVKYDGNNDQDYTGISSAVTTNVPPLSDIGLTPGKLTTNKTAPFLAQPISPNYLLSAVFDQPGDTGSQATSGAANASGTSSKAKANTTLSQSNASAAGGKPASKGSSNRSSRFNTDNADYFNFASLSSPQPDFIKTTIQNYSSDATPFDLANVKNATAGYKLVAMTVATPPPSTCLNCGASPNLVQLGVLNYRVASAVNVTPVGATAATLMARFDRPTASTSVMFSNVVSTLTEPAKVVQSLPYGGQNVLAAVPTAAPAHVDNAGVQFVRSQDIGTNAHLGTLARFVEDVTSGNIDEFAAAKFTATSSSSTAAGGRTYNLMAGWRNTTQQFDEPLGTPIVIAGTQGPFYLGDFSFTQSQNQKLTASLGYSRWFSKIGPERFETSYGLAYALPPDKHAGSFSLQGKYSDSAVTQNLIFQQDLNLRTHLSGGALLPVNGGSLAFKYESPGFSAKAGLDSTKSTDCVLASPAPGLFAAPTPAPGTQIITCQQSQKGSFTGSLGYRAGNFAVQASRSSMDSEPSGAASVTKKATNAALIAYTFDCFTLSGAAYNRSSIDRISTVNGTTLHSELAFLTKYLGISFNYDVATDKVNGTVQHAAYFRVGRGQAHQSSHCSLERQLGPDLGSQL